MWMGAMPDCAVYACARSGIRFFTMGTYKDIPLTKKLMLKFSTIVPGHQQETIDELVRRHGLRIEESREEAHLRLLTVVGESASLAALDQDLVRHASIARRMVSTPGRLLAR